MRIPETSIEYSFQPRTIGKTATEILAPELFRLFGEHQAKYKGVSSSSIESRYKPIVRMLEKYLNKPAHTIGKRQVDNFVAICQETISGRTAKERLRWKHLGADYTTAWIGESISRGHHNLKTKTGKAKTIQLPPTLQAALVLRYQKLQPKPDDLVFPAPRGGAIDDNRFRSRCWKTILEICNIEYRKPYAIRHSAISHALANGANPIALAELTGHDRRVLLDTYAHAIAKE